MKQSQGVNNAAVGHVAKEPFFFFFFHLCDYFLKHSWWPCFLYLHSAQRWVFGGKFEANLCGCFLWAVGWKNSKNELQISLIFLELKSGWHNRSFKTFSLELEYRFRKNCTSAIFFFFLLEELASKDGIYNLQPTSAFSFKEAFCFYKKTFLETIFYMHTEKTHPISL